MIINPGSSVAVSSTKISTIEETTWTISVEALERGEFGPSDTEGDSDGLGMSSLEERFRFLTSIWLFSNKGWIEWLYTIDLDLEIFSVNNFANFPLGNILKDWINRLDNFDSLPVFIPRSEESLVDQTLVSTYSCLRSVFIRPKRLNRFPPGKQSAVCFARRLHRQWAKMTNRLLKHCIF